MEVINKPNWHTFSVDAANFSTYKVIWSFEEIAVGAVIIV